jgi:hypothetical protein
MVLRTAFSHADIVNPNWPRFPERTIQIACLCKSTYHFFERVDGLLFPKVKIAKISLNNRAVHQEDDL